MYHMLVTLPVEVKVTVLAKDLASANMRPVYTTCGVFIVTGELNLVAFWNMLPVENKLGDWKLIGWLKLEALLNITPAS